MSSATVTKTRRSEDQLEELATSLFTNFAECDVLCTELQEAEDQLESLEESGQATAAAKARIVARIRAITTQRRQLHCKPCDLQ